MNSIEMRTGVVLLHGFRSIAKTNVTIANTVTETSIFPSAANSINSAIRAKVPANRFQVGDKIRVNARGTISTVGVGPGTLTCKVKKDSTALATGTSPTLAAGLSAAYLEIEFEMEVVSIGAGGTVDIFGKLTIIDPTLGTVFSVPIIAAAAALDTTAEWVFGVTLTWSVNDASNTLTIYTSECWLMDVE